MGGSLFRPTHHPRNCQSSPLTNLADQPHNVQCASSEDAAVHVHQCHSSCNPCCGKRLCARSLVSCKHGTLDIDVHGLQHVLQKCPMHQIAAIDQLQIDAVERLPPSAHACLPPSVDGSAIEVLGVLSEAGHAIATILQAKFSHHHLHGLQQKCPMHQIVAIDVHAVPRHALQPTMLCLHDLHWNIGPMDRSLGCSTDRSSRYCDCRPIALPSRHAQAEERERVC